MPLESFVGSGIFENVEQILCNIPLAESCFFSTRCIPILFSQIITTTEPAELTEGIQTRIRRMPSFNCEPQWQPP